MKNKSILLSFLLVAVFACNKDKFTSAPQIKIKNISPATVVTGNLIEVKGSFTDDEGDLDSVLIVFKLYNSTAATRVDTSREAYGSIGVPSGTRSAEIFLRYNYNRTPAPYISGYTKDTTAAFGMILIDKKKQRSNYAESEKIRLKKP